MPETWNARCKQPCKTRSSAIRSCSRRPAPVLINSKITSIVAAHSRNWCRNEQASPTPGRPVDLKLARSTRFVTTLTVPGRRKDKDAKKPAARPQTVWRHAGALPDRRSDGFQRLGHDRERTIRRGLHISAAPADLRDSRNCRNVLADEYGLPQTAATKRGLHRPGGDVPASGLRIFPRPLARNTPLVPHGPIQLSAVGNGQAGPNRFLGLVSRIAARAQRLWNRRPAAHITSSARHNPCYGRPSGERTGHGHSLHDPSDLDGDAFRRRALISVHRRNLVGSH